VPLTVAGENSEAFICRLEEGLRDSPGVWILKPADSSNAVGLTVFDSIGAVREVMDADQGVGMEVKDGMKIEVEKQWVAQKYIENPLLIDGRKFHIRGWVLARGSVSVYVHEECMCLVSTQQFNVSPEDFNNKAMHCTNHHSVQAQVEGYSFEDNALPLSDLNKHLHRTGRYLDQDPQAIIFAQMKHLARTSFASVVGSRKKFFCVDKCFEYFG